MLNEQTVLFRDIPREVFVRAADESKRFSTILILDGKPAGSGTFIRWGEHYGILTAHHVIHNPHDSSRRFNFTGNQKLALQVEENREHWFEIEMRTCRCVDVGVPLSQAQGPDLSVIILPSVGIGTLKAKKQFYNISVNTGQKLQNALLDTGPFLFAGCPAKLCEEHAEPSGDVTVSSTHAGASTGLHRRYEDGGFDFLELNVSYHQESEALDSFDGMSGGGVWRFPLFKHISEPPAKATFKDIFLAGVVFYQTDVEAGKRRIRCHGGKSIFVNTLRTLNDAVRIGS